MPTWIDNVRRILADDPQVLAILDEGTLALRTAIAIARDNLLTEAEQQAAAEAAESHVEAMVRDRSVS